MVSTIGRRSENIVKNTLKNEGGRKGIEKMKKRGKTME